MVPLLEHCSHELQQPEFIAEKVMYLNLMIEEDGEYINFLFEGLVVTHTVHRVLWKTVEIKKHDDFESVYLNWVLR